jgi:hypothetical protein
MKTTISVLKIGFLACLILKSTTLNLHAQQPSVTRGVIQSSTQGSTSNIIKEPTKGVLIANYIYQYTDDYPILTHPLDDCLALKKVLISKYNFSDVTIYENLDGDSLINLFNDLYAFQGDLFIFYAGHGDTTHDNGGGVSFIVPVDFNEEHNLAGKSELFTYGNLTGKLTNKRERKIQTKHLFFVSDACFSGMDDIEDQMVAMRASISDEQDLETAYMNPAAYYLASSINRPVSDKSWFLENFISILANNENNFISATQINAELTVNRNKADKRSLEQQGITMNTHVFKKMSPYREGDFIFFKRDATEQTSKIGGAGAPTINTETIKKPKVYLTFEINEMDGELKNIPLTTKNGIQKECFLKIKTKYSEKIDFDGNLETKNQIVYKIDFRYNNVKKRQDPVIIISCYIGENATLYKQFAPIPCPQTYFIEKDGKSVLDWNNSNLKTDIADKCKYLFGDAYDDQKIKQ